MQLMIVSLNDLFAGVQAPTNGLPETQSNIQVNR